MSFQKGKTPGLDGIPVAIYQTFYEQIKNQLLTCFNYSYEQGVLSGTQKESVISLLLKQDPNGHYKDPVHLRNWRPLTLQNYDIKTLAKCIATRIKTVTQQIVHQDQTGFIQGRNISNNIIQVVEIIEYYDNAKNLD